MFIIWHDVHHAHHVGVHVQEQQRDHDDRVQPQLWVHAPLLIMLWCIMHVQEQQRDHDDGVQPQLWVHAHHVVVHVQEQQRDHDDGVQPQLWIRGRELHAHGPPGGRQRKSQTSQVRHWHNFLRQSLRNLKNRNKWNCLAPPGHTRQLS